MIPGLIQWVKDTALSCDVGHRSGLDLALLWLWHRPGATAPIDFTPSLGTSICCGCSPEKKKIEKMCSCASQFLSFNCRSPMNINVLAYRTTSRYKRPDCVDFV